jgi:hypothetical protein
MGCLSGERSSLGVDPFFYFEELAKLPGMPPLVYRWRIERIERDMAPWIEVEPRGFERDPSRPGWNDVEATDAWNDDGGLASYLLHACSTHDQADTWKCPLDPGEIAPETLAWASVRQ